MFFGDPAILAADPVTATVRLPYGGWEIAAIPEAGWAAPRGFWTARALFALAGLCWWRRSSAPPSSPPRARPSSAVIRDREAELSRLSWRLEFALKASKVGVWDADLATDELMWDERAKEIFGFPDRTGLFGEKDWLGAVHPDDRARVEALALNAASGAGNFETSYRILRSDGEIRHIRDMAALYEGEDGSRRLVGLVWDVTPDVEREAELTCAAWRRRRRRWRSRASSRR